MREDFRCGACGHNFNFSFRERNRMVTCPECRQAWKIEQSSLGFFRFFMYY